MYSYQNYVRMVELDPEQMIKEYALEVHDDFVYDTVEGLKFKNLKEWAGYMDGIDQDYKTKDKIYRTRGEDWI